MPESFLERIIRQALREDLGKKGDITVAGLFSSNPVVSARLMAKGAGIICGTQVFSRVFQFLSKKFHFRFFVKEGEKVKPGQLVAEVCGPVKEMLICERTALNFLQHLSGIATLTRCFVQAAGSRIKILDTRKTTPNLRLLEKYAVRIGGGVNHRSGLFDSILIKDNHITALSLERNVSREKAINLSVQQARKKFGCRYPVEVEVNSFRQALTAYQAGADIIMFDNTSPGTVKKFARIIRKKGRKVILEWSGGVTLQNLKKIRSLPIDWVSVGRLTHSAPALDFSLKIAG